MADPNAIYSNDNIYETWIEILQFLTDDEKVECPTELVIYENVVETLLGFDRCIIMSGPRGGAWYWQSVSEGFSFSSNYMFADGDCVNNLTDAEAALMCVLGR